MRITLFVFLLIFATLSNAQESAIGEPRYIAEIIDGKENYFVSGALYSLNDSGVVLTCSNCSEAEFRFFLVPVPFERMGIVKIQSKNNICLSRLFISSSLFLGGLPASQLSYFLIRASVDDSFNQQMKAGIDQFDMLAKLSIIGAVPGVIVAYIASRLYKEKIFLNNDKRLFDENKALLAKYCFAK